jgi:hypothetical protein
MAAQRARRAARGDLRAVRAGDAARTPAPHGLGWRSPRNHPAPSRPGYALWPHALRRVEVECTLPAGAAPDRRAFLPVARTPHALQCADVRSGHLPLPAHHATLAQIPPSSRKSDGRPMPYYSGCYVRGRNATSAITRCRCREVPKLPPDPPTALAVALALMAFSVKPVAVARAAEEGDDTGSAFSAADHRRHRQDGHL